jgi:hypothetical protein
MMSASIHAGAHLDLGGLFVERHHGAQRGDWAV